MLKVSLFLGVFLVILGTTSSLLLTDRTDNVADEESLLVTDELVEDRQWPHGAVWPRQWPHGAVWPRQWSHGTYGLDNVRTNVGVWPHELAEGRWKMIRADICEQPKGVSWLRCLRYYWWYNAANGTCERFTGCQPFNGQGFKSSKACVDRCGGTPYLTPEQQYEDERWKMNMEKHQLKKQK